jgi:hypothetical protein
MALLLKTKYLFNAIFIKIPMTFITEDENCTLKFTGKNKRPLIDKALMSKRATLKVSQCLTLNYIRAIAIKTAWYWHKNRYEDQWNRIEDLNMNTHSYAQLIFDKGAKNI